MIPLHERLLTFVETELLADFPPCDVAGELYQLSEELVPGWEGGGARVASSEIKEAARHTLKSAINRGWIIKPTVCERCNQKTTQARLHGHHHDYRKPLEVQWLCIDCHSTRHPHLRRKLTAEIARSVRSSTDSGKELAARFGVSQATISQIRRGHTWRDA